MARLLASHPRMRAAAITELRRRVQQAVDETAPGAIPPEMTFRQWCEHLAVAGLKIDNHPFSLQDRPAIAPLPVLEPERSGKAS